MGSELQVEKIVCPNCGSENWGCWDQREWDCFDKKTKEYVGSNPVGYLNCRNCGEKWIDTSNLPDDCDCDDE